MMGGGGVTAKFPSLATLQEVNAFSMWDILLL